jgi:hypothetical protein
MTKFQLELIKNGKITETKTSGSRLDLIMKARKTEHDHAYVKNQDCGNKIVWQSHKNH